MFSRRWVRWVALLTIWTFPAILTAGLIHARMVQLGQESSFWVWLLSKQLVWWVWALLTPLIAVLGRRFPLDRGWIRHGLIHLGIGSVVGAAHAALEVLISMIVHSEPLTVTIYVDETIPHLMYRGPWALLVYWGILGISHAFEYYGRLKDRELSSTRLEAQVVQAQLDALQRQLQPHFLFNTLNSISILIRKGDAETANRMLSGLGDLLRYVLARDNKPQVPLAEELDFVRKYVEIEQMRFGDRLQVAINATPDALKAGVPGFVAQTLVENAIRHGVSPKPDGGTVTINAECADGRLRLSVSDNGVGFPEKVPDAAFDGVGLRNTRQRLQHLYGDDHQLTIRNSNSSGVVACLDIPLRTLADTTESSP